MTQIPGLCCRANKHLRNFCRFGITEIDFFSLDVEGGELDILRTVDFSRFKINVLMFERGNKERDAEIHQLLASAGMVHKYNVALGGMNAVYIHETFLNKVSQNPEHHQVTFDPDYEKYTP